MLAKKVLIAIPCLLRGGTEMQTMLLVRALVELGHDVEVCCYFEMDESVVAEFKAAGANVQLLGWSRSIGTIAFIRALAEILRVKSPDVVHVQYMAPGLLPILAARLGRIQVIFATVHIAGSVAYGGKAKFLLSIAARLCNTFICVSRGVEEFWFGDSEIYDPVATKRKRKHFTIYNAIDTIAITATLKAVDRHEMKEMLGITGRPVIGIVGRIVHQKGHTILFDAMTEVIREIPDVVLMIIGEGPERQKLMEKASSLNIKKNIIWLGEQTQNKVFEFYAIMDIFAMPSLYEGFGLTAAEAMTAGVPVVGTRIEGLSEVIEDGVSGLLVPPQDSVSLASALIALLKDKERRREMGAAARMRVEENYAYTIFRERLRALYSPDVEYANKKSNLIFF
jgi:L-malate glycosyltransferase